MTFMKNSYLFILLSLPFFSFSQNYFSACKQIPLELGAGFDISNPVELKQRAFETSTSIYDEESAETSISYSIIHNHRELQEQLELDAAINARLLFTSLKGTFELDESVYSSDDYTTIMFKANTHFGNKGFESYILRPEAKALIDSSKFDYFIERYGTHFVQKTSTGVSISVFISIENSYFQENEDLYLEGNAEGRLIGGEMALNKALTLANEDNALRIEIYSNGPKDGINSLSNIIRSSENPIENIQNEISNYLKKFDRESSKTIGLYYTPFSQFGLPKSKINWNNLREKNLIDIKSEYEICLENMNQLLSVKSECLYLKGDSKPRGAFDSFILDYKNYLDSIIKLHKQCLDLSDDHFNNEIFNASFNEEPFSKIVEELSLVVDDKLSDSQIPSGIMSTWTLKETCPVYQNTHLSFSASFFLDPTYAIYSNYQIKPKIEFFVNDISLGTYIYTINGKGKIVFDKDLDFELLGGDLKFGISVKEITGVDPDGINGTFKKLPVTDCILKVKIN
jgi:hypothetical protein